MASCTLPIGIDMMRMAPALLSWRRWAAVLGQAASSEATWAAARHGSPQTEHLVAVGTTVARCNSAFVTLWPTLAEAWGSSPT